MVAVPNIQEPQLGPSLICSSSWSFFLGCEDFHRGGFVANLLFSKCQQLHPNRRGAEIGEIGELNFFRRPVLRGKAPQKGGAWGDFHFFSKPRETLPLCFWLPKLAD